MPISVANVSPGRYRSSFILTLRLYDRGLDRRVLHAVLEGSVLGTGEPVVGVCS